MTLETADGSVIALDKAEMLDKVSANEKATLKNDLISHIQLADLEVGEYRLVI